MFRISGLDLGVEALGFRADGLGVAAYSLKGRV